MYCDSNQYTVITKVYCFVKVQVQMQQQQHHQQSQQQGGLLSPGLSFAELDSPTMSLPSPGCSLDGTSGSLSPPASISGRRDSAGGSGASATDIASIPSLQVRVNILQQRVSSNQLVQVTAFHLCGLFLSTCLQNSVSTNSIIYTYISYKAVISTSKISMAPLGAVSQRFNFF